VWYKNAQGAYVRRPTGFPSWVYLVAAALDFTLRISWSLKLVSNAITGAFSIHACVCVCVCVCVFSCAFLPAPLMVCFMKLVSLSEVILDPGESSVIMASSLELFRRTMWACLRVEYEAYVQNQSALAATPKVHILLLMLSLLLSAFSTIPPVFC
jgi:hypothetical protein